MHIIFTFIGHDSLLLVLMTPVSIRGETIWVNAILPIVFECIAIYCHIAICDWILVKDISYENMGFGSKEKNIHPVKA